MVCGTRLCFPTKGKWHGESYARWNSYPLPVINMVRAYNPFIFVTLFCNKDLIFDIVMLIVLVHLF